MRRRSEIQRSKSLLGVAAKNLKRVERVAALRDVGGLTTDGCLGVHSIRLLAYPDESEVRLAVVVDGQHRQARTLRGVVRCVARMVLNRAQKGIKA